HLSLSRTTTSRCPCFFHACLLTMAERVGFEPTVQLPGQRFSRPPDSATLAPLHVLTRPTPGDTTRCNHEQRVPPPRPFPCSPRVRHDGPFSRGLLDQRTGN